MHQIILFQDKKSKKFLPVGGGNSPFIHPTPLGAYGSSILARTALDTRTRPFESPGSATASDTTAVSLFLTKIR